MKIKCIENDLTHFDISFGKIYEVQNETDQFYEIINDVGKSEVYYKWRFEVVGEETDTEMKLVCVDIDNIGNELTLGKIYDIRGETSSSYRILNDHNDFSWYAGYHFRIVRTIKKSGNEKESFWIVASSFSRNISYEVACKKAKELATEDPDKEYIVFHSVTGFKSNAISKIEYK
jgi:hypothetical protein